MMSERVVTRWRNQCLDCHKALTKTTKTRDDVFVREAMACRCRRCAIVKAAIRQKRQVEFLRQLGVSPDGITNLLTQRK